ncbi:MAG: hypothetical protein J7M18_08615 [Candidatus Eremiobacteraeota bacterium]|nr:hypothetical protein [Candidatus Eremiobacteraeota bacterium]
MFNIGNLIGSIGVGGIFNPSAIQSFSSSLTTGSVPFHAIDPGLVNQPLHAGIFDPSTLIPGMGLAGDVPEPPPYEYYQSLFGIQKAHERDQKEFLFQAQADIIAKKERVFNKFHYEFNEEGNPIIDEETGHPKLFEGGESAEQRGSRISWETRMKDELHERQEEEAGALQESSRIRLEEAHEEYSANPSDPEALTKLHEATSQIHAEEDALKMQHAKENLLFSLEGLPDPDTAIEVEDPETGEVTVQYTGTLTEFGEQKFADYEALIAQHREEEAQSNENIAITGYFQQLISFIANQRQQLADLQLEAESSDTTMDPEALRRLVFGEE